MWPESQALRSTWHVRFLQLPLLLSGNSKDAKRLHFFTYTYQRPVHLRKGSNDLVSFNLYDQHALYNMFLLNSILFNALYTVFVCIKNKYIVNIGLCGAIGALLHFFLLTTFGYILVMMMFRFHQIFKPSPVSTKYSAISTFAVNCKFECE
jgi:hypothetical protein